MPEKLQPKLDRFLKLLSQHQPVLPPDLLFAALDLGAEVNRVRMERTSPPAVRPNSPRLRIPAEQLPPYPVPFDGRASGRIAVGSPLVHQGLSCTGGRAST